VPIFRGAEWQKVKDKNPKILGTENSGEALSDNKKQQTGYQIGTWETLAGHKQDKQRANLGITEGKKAGV